MWKSGKREASVDLVESEGVAGGRRREVGRRPDDGSLTPDGGGFARRGVACKSGEGLRGVRCSGPADELLERGEEGVCSVGAVVAAVAVTFADNELRGAELGQLGLDCAEGEAAAAGKIAQVELGGGVGEEQAKHFGADFREKNGEQVHGVWLIQSDDWLKQSIKGGKRGKG